MLLAIICRACMCELMRFEPAGDKDSQERVKEIIAPIVRAVEAHSKKTHSGNRLDMYISQIQDQESIPNLMAAAFFDNDGDSDYGAV